ncbi:hypothetical protein BCA37_30920 (plasmid) [Mycobacterium sp. djl-10]|nr:hypothetical protein BCA37_30920 [Mycobacterium sp. djl-10]
MATVLGRDWLHDDDTTCCCVRSSDRIVQSFRPLDLVLGEFLEKCLAGSDQFLDVGVDAGPPRLLGLEAFKRLALDQPRHPAL